MSGAEERSVSRKTLKTSFIWTHFDKHEAESGMATCFKCRKKYKTSGNTSNLRDHLRRVHNITDEIVEGNISSCEDGPPKKKSRLQTIEHCFTYNNVYEDDNKKKKILDRRIVDMIAIDMQPFNIVSDRGFKFLINDLNPRYKLPSATTLKTSLLPQRYSDLRSKLQKWLKNARFVSLTTDCWTSSVSNDSYITVTCHYIHQYELFSFVLETEKFSGNHTATRLSEYLRNVMSNWNLQGKVVCIVSDNAANIKAAIELLGIQHMPCAAHTLNLTVTDALSSTNEITELIAKCRRIVARFKRSTVAMDILRTEQTVRNEPHLKLLQDVPTRWNSVYIMISRILDIRDALSLALLKLDDVPGYLTKEDFMILEDIRQILEPFNDASEQLCGQKYPTLSLIISIHTGICSHLKELNLVSGEGKIFKLNILQGLSDRFSQYELKNLSRIATILDPRFKKLVFRNADHARSATAAAQTEITNINKQNINEKSDVPERHPTSADSECSTSTQNKNCQLGKFKLFKFLQEKTENLKLNLAPATGIILLRQYLEIPNAAIDENPLEYWSNKNDKCFTILIEKYFCVPATSVPAERLFSKSGQLLNEKRSKLKPKNVNMLLFINYNSSLVK